jgi:tetratricopeptide (TPR) repeat protein
MWIERIRVERENLLAAHAWCGRDDGNEQADMQLVLPILVVCSIDGNLELGARMATEALERPGAREANLLRCRALLQACQLAYFMARYPQARIWGEEGLAIARVLGSSRRIATALRLLGMIGIGQGDNAFARSHLEQSVATAREVGDGYQLSAAAGSLADLLRMDGSLDAAEALYEEVLGLCRGRGDRGGEAAMSVNLALVSIGRGDVDRAREHLAAALAIAREVQLANVTLAALDAAAGFAAITGAFAMSVRVRSAAEAHRRRTGIRLEPVDEAFLRPWLERARASLDATAVAQAEAAGRAQSYDEILTEAAAWLAQWSFE